MPTEEKHTLWFHLFDVVMNIVIIIAVVAGLRTFLASPFQIEGNSMLSTLNHSEYIIINKLAYHIGTPERGDVVVFRPPNAPKTPYVKRVIGIAGDAIKIKDGLVYIKTAQSLEFEELEEPYLNAQNRGKTFRSPVNSGNKTEINYEVPEGTYFLMGDNRQGSQDSRSLRDRSGQPIPYIPEKSILGRVWYVVLPVGEMREIIPATYDL